MISFKKLVSILVVLFVCFALSVNGYSAEKKSAEAPAKTAKLININTAGVDQLVVLPRIGEKIAQRIIDYRQKNGKFKKPADIMKVKGIGEKTFEKFKEMITV
jgi:comEA protein